MSLQILKKPRHAAVATALAGALAWAPPALAGAPDLAFETPVARGGAQAHTAVSGAKLSSGLNRYLRRSGGKGGAWVGDPETGATLFASGSDKAFQIASNMKLFTTAAALSLIGPNETFDTQLVASGEYESGVLRGDLILVGDGDPTLAAKGLGKLAAEARAAGLERVTGRLLFDESAFDKRRSVPQKGISGGPFNDVGRMSGLAYEGGRSPDPARSAALDMISVLRKRGVSVGKKTGAGKAPEQPTPEQVLADSESPSLSSIARTTNVFSVNFYAEMLMKAIGADERGVGTTAGGAAEVKAFASDAGAALRTQNGSGLSRSDRASPRSVGALLDSMLDAEEPVMIGFLNSLAVAGRTGTLAGRMRGTAAQDRCFGKTGTLTGVSALSGYCEVADDRFIVFSILMQRVDIGRAHTAQDRMTSLIARYTP